MYISSLEHFARYQHVDGGQDADPTAKLHLFPASDIPIREAQRTGESSLRQPTVLISRRNL